MKTDVAIVGAGPVGLVVANLLGIQGIDCILIEQNDARYLKPRAQTLDDESLRTLQCLGIIDKVLAITREASGSHYYDAENHCFAEVGPGPQTYGFAKRRYMLQQQIDQLLLQNLSNYPSVKQRFQTRLLGFDQTIDTVSLQLSDHRNQSLTLHARWLLACDGGRSFVRQQLDIGMQGRTYEQDWLILDTIDDPDQDSVSRFFCNPARPAVSIPSPNGGRRYEFMLLPGETPERILQADSLKELLAPFRPYDETKIIRKVVYTFHARSAGRWRDRRIFLSGDAAHLSPPFAGQGLNTGIRDAHNLAWKIALVVKEQASPEILSSYERERREPAWAMIQLAVAMGDFIMPRADQQEFRHLLTQALERFPEAKNYLFQMRFKPRPRYDDGLFVGLDSQEYEHSLVGEMIPQPRVKKPEGQSIRLDDALGSGFAVIVQSDAAEKTLSTLSNPLWKAIDPTCIRLYPPETCPEPKALPAVALSDNSIGRPLRTHRDQILLIRPDRYAMGACLPAQLPAFLDQFDQLLQQRP